MSFKKSDYCTLVQQASDVVPGFQQAHHKFVEHAAILRKSIEGYDKRTNNDNTNDELV